MRLLSYSNVLERYAGNKEAVSSETELELQGNVKYDCVPKSLWAAPYSIPLVVVSDVLLGVNTIPEHPKFRDLLRGSIVIRIHTKVVEEMLGSSYGNIQSDSDVLYVLTGYYRDDNTGKPIQKDNHLITTSFPGSNGLFVPLTEVYYEYFKHSPFLGQEEEPYLTKESIMLDVVRDFTKDAEDSVRKLLQPYSGLKTVVVQDLNGSEFRKSWKNTAQDIDVVRWTITNEDLHYYVRDIMSVHILRS